MRGEKNARRRSRRTPDVEEEEEEVLALRIDTALNVLSADLRSRGAFDNYPRDRADTASSGREPRVARPRREDSSSDSGLEEPDGGIVSATAQKGSRGPGSYTLTTLSQKRMVHVPGGEPSTTKKTDCKPNN